MRRQVARSERGFADRLLGWGVEVVVVVLGVGVWVNR